MYNKEPFLDQVASKLGRERRTEGVVRPKWKHSPQLRVFQGMSQDELTTVLVEQCKKIHTEVDTINSDELNATINKVMERFGAKSMISWDDPRFEEYGVDQYFKEASANGLINHTWDRNIGEENIQIAEKSDVGMTFSDITLAESGTVVLLSNSGNGRSVSLLPKYYIAIIPKSTIVPRMTQATTAIHKIEEEKGRVPSCINFISGPSNSADIEMNLVVGVHGPIKASYIILMDK